MNRLVYSLICLVLLFPGLSTYASTLSERQYRLLEKAQELVAEESYQEALEETQDAQRTHQQHSRRRHQL